MARSDFSPPYIAGVGSSPSRRGPLRHKANGSEMRSPRFRYDPFAAGARQPKFFPDAVERCAEPISRRKRFVEMGYSESALPLELSRRGEMRIPLSTSLKFAIKWTGLAVAYNMLPEPESLPCFCAVRITVVSATHERIIELLVQGSRATRDDVNEIILALRCVCN
jgi:hypothetical protein